MPTTASRSCASSASRAFLNEWLKERCEKLVKDGKIKPNPELLVEHDDQRPRDCPSSTAPACSFR